LKNLYRLDIESWKGEMKTKTEQLFCFGKKQAIKKALEIKKDFLEKGFYCVIFVRKPVQLLTIVNWDAIKVNGKSHI
jgi:hypothetical protein